MTSVKVYETISARLQLGKRPSRQRALLTILIVSMALRGNTATLVLVTRGSIPAKNYLRTKMIRILILRLNCVSRVHFVRSAGP